MNPGSDPERDDTGLPPVDIEIPDDARELDRDVQAYHREQRAQRRSSRGARLRGSMSRDGIAMPLLACCFIFVLITGTLLTVFTTSGINQGMPGAGRPGVSSPIGSGGPAAGSVPTIPTIYRTAALPAKTIMEAGHLVPLQTLQSAVLLLVPANCGCVETLADLAYLMTSHGVDTLLVAPGVPATELAGAEDYGARLATDPLGALRGYWRQDLTAVLVAPNRTVSYADGLQYGDNMNGLMAAAGG